MTEHLLYNKVALVDWQKMTQDTPVYLLAESAINPLVRTLADDALKHNLSADEENALYWGEMGKVHASISPYLLKLEGWSDFEKNIAFQPHWGILLIPREEALTRNNSWFYLLHHLREWTLIEPDQGSHEQGAMLLRLSDWEVLQVLLNASNPSELTSLFGPFETFAYWHKDQTHVQQISLNTRQQSTLPHRSPQRLSEKQHSALKAFAHRHQHKKYADHLRQHHSDVENWSDNELSTFLLRNIDTANRLQFTNEKDVIRYLSLATVLGEQFIETSWAQQPLNAPSVMGTLSRMDKLYQCAIEQLDKEHKG
ncbi:DUF4123 domain-containing protein [Vibrio sp. M250220]|uniref:DUF4123 domain-containing protein n=1 Tax=Vibrio sp. M250220 TaxID=3020894 RepID=UPI002F427F32